MCVLGLSTTFVWNIYIYLILIITEQHRSEMQIGLHEKYPLLLPDFNETWTFLTDFRKILKYQKLNKLLSVGAELFHADGRTDWQKDRHDKTNSRTSQLCERA
jgi:hypothetical protein